MRKHRMFKGFQSKLPTYIPKDDVVPIESTAFLDEVRLSGILESISLPDRCGKYPSVAHLSFVIYMHIKNFSFIKTLGVVRADEDLRNKLGYEKNILPTQDSVRYFMEDILTHDGRRELFLLVDDYRYDKNFFITDTNMFQSLQKDNKFSFTVREKRLLAKSIVKYVHKYINVDLKLNTTYNTDTIFDAVMEFLSECASANFFSNTFRDDPVFGVKKRQRAPTGRTLLNRLRMIFTTRVDVEKFFDFLLSRMIALVKREVPNAFNHRKFDLAFDHTMIPAHDNQKLFFLKTIDPDNHKRNIYTHPKDLVDDSHIKGKGTISFRKFLCCSIVIKGFRFCVCYLPITMDNNKGQAPLINNMIDKIKKYIPTQNIRYFYMDRGFDTKGIHRLLKMRGMKYFMAKVRTKGGLAKRIAEVKSDLEIFSHKISKKEKITIIVVKSTVKNKMLFPEDDAVEDGTDIKKFAFATNIKVNMNNALELLNGYRSRWSIETMFRDKNAIYGKTTSNDNIIRDFYFSHTMTLFNMWILCNIILCYCWLKTEPFDPKITLKTFKKYIRSDYFYSPPPE